jgi:small-conductance mechanosensitive channel
MKANAMLRLNDLSEMERQSWATLIADGFIFVWFWKSMAPGWSLKPADFDPASLSSLFISLVVLTVIVHIAIASIFSFRRRKDEVEFDERDLDAQSFGSRIAYNSLYLGIGAVIMAVLTGYILPEDVVLAMRITDMVHVLFALVMLCFVADLLRNAAMILRYNRVV